LWEAFVAIRVVSAIRELLKSLVSVVEFQRYVGKKTWIREFKGRLEVNDVEVAREESFYYALEIMKNYTAIFSELMCITITYNKRNGGNKENNTQWISEEQAPRHRANLLLPKFQTLIL
jgi:hypothetical protein